MSGKAFAHSPRTLLHVAAELRRRDISPVELFGRLGLPPSAVLNANGWVPRELCFALTEEAKTVTGDKYFTSRIGESYELTELGAWGRMIVGAANVGEACAVAARNVGLLHEGSGLHLLTSPRHSELRLEYHGRLGANPRQHLIGTLVVLRKIALLGKTPEAISVRFSMPYSRGADRLEETHGSRLEFGCDYDSVVINRDLLELIPNGAGDRDAVANFELDDAVAAIGPLLKRLLPYGRASIRAVAAQQRVSTRTVQRKLKAWGFSFEEILDDVRRTEAIRYVLAGEYSAMEIALVLGYSDAAHFTRAFRRWTGMPPRDYALRFRSSSLSGTT
jgi:AraC-like DNA-binding protein